MSSGQLGVWLHGDHIADIERVRKEGIRVRYTPETLDAHDHGLPILSCSLPLRERPIDGRWFFTGLLPEGFALQSMAQIAGVAAHDTYALIERFGRDVAGAVVVSDEEPNHRSGGVEEYSDEGLDEAVSSLPEHPLDLRDDSELSLPGVQNKLLLVQMPDGRWGRPIGGRPSTHILKVEDRRFSGMAELEATCLALARQVGLTDVGADVVAIGDVPCLIVSRFDRELDRSGQVIGRIHQEDACQALNIDPVGPQGRGKYYSADGPSHRKIASLLDKWGTDGEHELMTLLRAVTFTVSIGNADAHGKNVSFLHRSPGVIELAPLYDTVPTLLWPRLKRRTPALPIGPRLCDLDDLRGSDLVAEARLWNLDGELAGQVVRSCIEDLDRALGVVDAPDPLRDLIGAQLERLSTGL